MTPPVALTIAGSDSGGGAGLQADLATFAAFGVHGVSVVTALTAQDTRGVAAIAAVDATFVRRQLDAVLDDFTVAAAKTGMLHRAPIIDAILARPLPPLVVDPVLVATSGAALLEPGAIDAVRDRLLPRTVLVTPNLAEAEALTGRPVRDVPGMRDAARALVALGARAAVVTGGHLPGDAVDVLYDGRTYRALSAPRCAGGPIHGTGCVFSAAVTAGLACGCALDDAVVAAKRFVTRAIERAAPLGHGARVLSAAMIPGRAGPSSGARSDG